jgi:hypothetical protein
MLHRRGAQAEILPGVRHHHRRFAAVADRGFTVAVDADDLLDVVVVHDGSDGDIVDVIDIGQTLDERIVAS